MPKRISGRRRAPAEQEELPAGERYTDENLAFENPVQSEENEEAEDTDLDDRPPNRIRSACLIVVVLAVGVAVGLLGGRGAVAVFRHMNQVEAPQVRTSSTPPPTPAPAKPPAPSSASSPVPRLGPATPDAGVRAIAALSARIAYAMMCLTLTWGVLTATGWVRSIGERKTLRGGHMVLATLTLAFGFVHAVSFHFLSQDAYGLDDLLIPLLGDGVVRHALGIIGFELMLAIALTAGLYRWTSYRHWLSLHRLAYPAVALTVVHSVLGAIANGHLAIVWLSGLTLLVPAVTVAVVRFLPRSLLAKIGLFEETPS